VANASMERAIRKISVERGYDPAEFTLVTFGGAGAMHSAFLAKQLNISKIIVPDNPGVLSAFGMLVADTIHDYSLTVMLQEDISYENIKKLFSPLEKRAEEDFQSISTHDSKYFIERFLDMRYRGQSYELVVPFTENFRYSFHKEHEKMYGYSNKERDIEIVNIRIRAKTLTKKPEITPCKTSVSVIPEKAYIGKSRTIFSGKEHDTKLFLRKYLKYGNRISGPAIILEYSSTTVIPPYAQMEVDQYRNLVITFRNDEK
jgi:N-methylhydantoinase A